MSNRLLFAVLFMAMSPAAGVSAADQMTPQAKSEWDRSNERDKAVRGGYEDKLDKAIDTYGGTRTREVIDEDRRIRAGERAGSGHTGDSAQPGLVPKYGQ